ncbi:hypothetical protein BRC67_03455 [Halobacteriales archaeon QH_3_68_24]|nr:MAG: hypothetical protein BRC67_03455 [Halobacteriales archaeon QH_3_68_24]
MTRKTRRDMLAALGATATLGLAGCSSDSEDGAADEDSPTPTEDTDGMTETPTERMGETDTPTATETMETANVRVAHFSPNAPNVDVYVDDEAVLEDVPFRTVSDYLAVPVGDRSIRITAAGDPDTVAFEGEVTVEAADYTVTAIGNLGGDENAFEPLVLEDDNSDIADDTARVRLVHAAPDAPAVDVTAGGSAVFDGAAYGEAATIEVPADTYTLQVRPDTDANDGDVVGAFPAEFAGGTVYTVFAAGYLSPEDAPGDAPFDLTATVDSGAGGGGLVDPANVRVGHFSPDAPNVDVYVDGDAVLTDIPFRALSDYLTIPSGTRTVEITAAGDPDTSVFEGDFDLAAADYTVAAIGELEGDAEFRPLVLEDDTSDPGDGQSRVRLVHVAPDAPAVDVTVNATGDALYDGVAFGETATGTVEANDYTLEVRGDTESNDGDVVADYDVSLDGNAVYTAFAVGYLSPDDEAVDEPFDLQVARDAAY